MAITWSVVGSYFDNGVDDLAVDPASTIPVGALVYVLSTASNSGTSGAACTTTCVDSAAGSTNTWTQRVVTNYDPGAANAGVTLTIFTCVLTTALTSANSITVSYSPTVSAAMIYLLQGVADAGETASYITAGAGATGSSTTPSITSGSITSGDTIIGAIAVIKPGINDDTVTGDSDTTNGSWSSMQGDLQINTQIQTQRKTVTATATQTYNPTIAAANNFAINFIVVRWTAGAAGPIARRSLIVSRQSIHRASRW